MGQIKRFLLHLIVLGCTSLAAQDNIHTLSSSLINKEGYLELPKTSQWRFKEGHDTAWANPNVDHSSWRKLDSVDIENLKIDDRGIFECWFRITIRLDSSLANTPLYLKLHNGSPADIYVNGKYFYSFGNTDYRNNNYKGVYENRDYSPSVTLPVNQEILIAVHFVEYQESFYQYLIESGNHIVRQNLLSLITESTFQDAQTRNKNYEIKIFSSAAGLSVFIILFWLIAFLNRTQKHLTYSAISVTILFIIVIKEYLNTTLNSLTSNLAAVNNLLNPVITILLFASFIYLVASILEVNIHRNIKLLVRLLILFSPTVFLYPQ